MAKRIILLVIGTVLFVAVSWGPIVSNVELARCEVVESHGAIEIRDYAPMIVAEVIITGQRENAISDGFRMLADYIFGNNFPAREIAMTAPVMQQSGEKIAMTAPVTRQGGDSGWVVRFVMPAEYSLDTLPRPNNPDVVLEEIAGKRFAVIRFPGRAKGDSLETHTRQLESFIQAGNLQARSEPAYAFFNPPWTLPFLRRNEVMIEIGS